MITRNYKKELDTLLTLQQYMKSYEVQFNQLSGCAGFWNLAKWDCKQKLSIPAYIIGAPLSIGCAYAIAKFKSLYDTYYTSLTTLKVIDPLTHESLFCSSYIGAMGFGCTYQKNGWPTECVVPCMELGNASRQLTGVSIGFMIGLLLLGFAIVHFSRLSSFEERLKTDKSREFSSELGDLAENIRDLCTKERDWLNTILEITHHVDYSDPDYCHFHVYDAIDDDLPVEQFVAEMSANLPRVESAISVVRMQLGEIDELKLDMTQEKIVTEKTSALSQLAKRGSLLWNSVRCYATSFLPQSSSEKALADYKLIP